MATDELPDPETERAIWSHYFGIGAGVAVYARVLRYDGAWDSWGMVLFAMALVLAYVVFHVRIYRRRRFTFHSLSHFVLFLISAFVGAVLLGGSTDGWEALIVMVVGMGAGCMVILGIIALAIFGGRKVSEDDNE